ncbi:MAG TPA: DNA polymerase III subunit gamma/tau [Thiomicrorhabdus sp.]|nr:DNA polymerase III subunit gamma/tau [Thiomicrorhabdus sp.]
MGSIANSTVLARKWRPKQFSELVGQSHVMQALANALDQQRLHHAYLFTGTRGVGKTTIARIFSKALNCEQGVSSTPCGVCDICRSIDEGRFIDLIEVDAASRTKVDDTREILDNVQFAPTQGRYKVYLIDEVHMLSKSSFNALLKTLEEPPEHVKFLLATTDPHKLPITVLSRCLQFNLMHLTQPQLQTHLEFIMAQEGLSFDKSALGLIAKAANGSARDALSLLDQAIAYGAGEVMFEPVQTMLGWVDQQYSVAILKALAGDDAEQLKQVIQQLAVMGVDYQALLAQLIEVLHALSYAQVFQDSGALTTMPEEIIAELASQLNPERVQLLYQIALLAKQDMRLAPDIRIGFEMSLIRMLAFQPVQQGEVLSVASSSTPSAAAEGGKQVVAQSPSSQNALEGLASARSLMANRVETVEPVAPRSQATEQGGGEIDSNVSQDFNSSISPPASNAVASSSDHLENIKARLKHSLGKPRLDAKASPTLHKAPLFTTPSEPYSASEAGVTSARVEESMAEPLAPQTQVDKVDRGGEEPLLEYSSDNIEQWLVLIDQLPLKGMAAEVARNSVLIRLSETQLVLSIDPSQNYSKQTMALEQFSNAVKQHFGADFTLEFVEAHQHFTPVKYAKQQKERRQKMAEESIQQDFVVQALTQSLGLEVIIDSIQPV